MEERKTRTRWSLEETMCLYTMIQERNGDGLDEFLESHRWRTRGAARKRYNLIKSGKIIIEGKNDAAMPGTKDGILFDIEDYRPFKTSVFARLWRFIKRLFRHDD